MTNLKEDIAKIVALLDVTTGSDDGDFVDDCEREAIEIASSRSENLFAIIAEDEQYMHNVKRIAAKLFVETIIPKQSREIALRLINSNEKLVRLGFAIGLENMNEELSPIRMW